MLLGPFPLEPPRGTVAALLDLVIEQPEGGQNFGGRVHGAGEEDESHVHPSYPWLPCPLLPRVKG